MAISSAWNLYICSPYIKLEEGGINISGTFTNFKGFDGKVQISPRGVIDMEHIDISITLLKQYRLLSLVNTCIAMYRNIKNMKMDTYRRNGELNIAGVARHILSKSISLHGHALLFLLHSKKKQ